MLSGEAQRLGWTNPEQSFCDNWLKRTRIECLDYTARPPVFVLADDPNLWRLVQTGIERHIIWRYDPNGIRVKDCWIRRNVYDRNVDGIVNLKDWNFYVEVKP